MNTKAVVSAVMAMTLTLSTGGLSFAQGYGDRNDQGRNNQGGQRGDRPDYRHDQGRRPDHRGNQGRPHNDERPDMRGAGPNHQFYRGGRLPYEYRTRQYVVEDWRGHRLSAPPRGYHWVQSGGDYILVAIATGIILQILLSN